jgi:hypothetical protein
LLSWGEIDAKAQMQVAIAYHDGANQLRKEAQSELSASLEKEEYETLNGTMCMFHHNSHEWIRVSMRSVAVSDEYSNAITLTERRICCRWDEVLYGNRPA